MWKTFLKEYKKDSGNFSLHNHNQKSNFPIKNDLGILLEVLNFKLLPVIKSRPGKIQRRFSFHSPVTLQFTSIFMFK